MGKTERVFLKKEQMGWPWAFLIKLSLKILKTEVGFTFTPHQIHQYK